MKLVRTVVRALGLVVVAGVLSTVVSAAPLEWNEREIRWMGLDEGLREASRAARPVCLVVYTQTCPHCRNYSGVFHDPRVVEKAKKFVMIKLDQGADDSQSRRYAPDGEYIPRTIFLSPEGEPQPQIHAARNRYLHFYDEHNPSSVLTAMNKALVLPSVGRAPAPAPSPSITSVVPLKPLAPVVPTAPPAPVAPVAPSTEVAPEAVAAPGAPSAPPAPAAPVEDGAMVPPSPQIVRDPSGQLVIQN
ncbi:MAG: thioredoxin family protein [Deltaproteobacteria bacterium]|nr:thioredoxin family protein [Deltaproteobacteria bacterium]